MRGRPLELVLPLALALAMIASHRARAKGTSLGTVAATASHLSGAIDQTVQPAALSCPMTDDPSTGYADPNHRVLDGSDPSGPNRNTDDFCGDPYNAVCGEYDLTIQDHFRRVTDVRNAATARGLIAAGKAALKAGLWKGDPEQFTQPDLTRLFRDKTIDLVPRILMYGAFHVAQREYLTARSNYNLVSTDGVRKDLDAAIVSAAPTGMLGSMTDLIDGVQLVGAEEAFKNGQSDELRDQFIQDCGADGMVNNMWAHTLSNGKRVVILCTGSLVAAQFDAAGNPVVNRQAALNNLLWALGHELGHHLSAPVNGDPKLARLNQPFLDCLKDNFKKGYQAGMAKEAMPDYWAAETTYKHLMSLGIPEGDYAKKLLVIQQSWGKLCETGADGVHPGGRMRIEVILRLNPEISSFMGCALPKAPDPPGCGIYGEAR